MKTKPSNRKPTPSEATLTDDELDIILDAIDDDLNAFVQFSKAHFDPTWHQRQPQLLRAILSLMADELIAVAHKTIRNGEQDTACPPFGHVYESGFYTAYKCMHDGLLINILTTLELDSNAEWMQHLAIRPEETDFQGGILPNNGRVLRAVCGRSLAFAITDMTDNPSQVRFVARQALFEGLCIAAQLGERAQEFEQRFEGHVYLHYLQMTQDASSRLMHESAGDMRWYATQMMEVLRQKQG